MGFFTEIGRRIKRFKQKTAITADEQADNSEEVSKETTAKKGHRSDESQQISDLDTDMDDPRRTTDKGRLEADTSEAALADESGEAVGPDPEQAEPVQTEGTEPEATPEEDTLHGGSDSVNTDKAVTDDGSEG